MSDDAKSEGKKKGSKMPIIVALALVLGGGGFFMTRGKGEAKPIEIEAAEESVPVGEMTANLKNSGMYLKLELLLLPRKDYAKEKLEKSLDLVRDYIATKIPDCSIEEVKSEAGRTKLKKDLCEGINAILPPDPKMVDPAADKKSKKGAKKEKKEEAPEEPENGWDSAKGPILKVMFKSFIWQ